LKEPILKIIPLHDLGYNINVDNIISRPLPAALRDPTSLPSAINFETFHVETTA
jgi:hypothetical protein